MIALLSAAMRTVFTSHALIAAAGLALGLICCVLGTQLHAPMARLFGGFLLPALIVTGVGLTIVFRPRPTPLEGPEAPLRPVRLAAFLTALASLTITTAVDARFQSIRNEVLAAPAEELARIGRHIMIGVDEPYELKKLIAAQAISGIFVTRRSARGRNMARLGAMIRDLDDQHRAKGGPPLWVAADQEGGVVQRLSPPLPRLASLSTIVLKHEDPLAREEAVRVFATAQGQALAKVGVNVNFAPVVDIDAQSGKRRDGSTRLAHRAISSDPATVADTARWYCDALWAQGVRCTRKHFPGLGRVFTDTHVREATLQSPLETLVKSDWVPFEAAQPPRADWVMVGHMQVAALDPGVPASASRPVIEKLRGLGHSGIVITDDFSMGAITKSQLGAGGAAVAALNAGVDMILVSYDSKLIYKVLHALLMAGREGKLDFAAIEASGRRLAAAAALPVPVPAPVVEAVQETALP